MRAGVNSSTIIQVKFFSGLANTSVGDVFKNSTIVDTEIVQNIGAQVDQEIFLGEPEYKRMERNRDEEDKQESTE